MRVRLHGGWQLGDGLCEDADRLARADAEAVPMGSDLPARPADASPRFLAIAQADPGAEGIVTAPLQRLQVIKGWVGEDGDHHQTGEGQGHAAPSPPVGTPGCVGRRGRSWTRR